MKKYTKIIVVALLAFALGFRLKGMIYENTQVEGRVTGIGGIFFKAKNPRELRNWYKENLGMKVNDYGAVFEWRQGSDSTQKGFSQWSPFKETTTYFEPSTKEFMLNFRVDNLEKLMVKLKIIR